MKTPRFPSRKTAWLQATRATSVAATAALAALVAPYATAATVSFEQDPFLGSTALATPGRQVFAGLQQVLPSFDVAIDRFALSPSVYGAYGLFLGGSNSLSFVNASTAGIPAAGADVIVLQDVDNDNNAATPFNAGTAANLIASAVDTDGAGFFVYFNSVLNVARLVFSTNLNSNSADLSVLARINSPSGQAAISALPSFNSSNFVSTVPEPSSALLLLSAALGAGAAGHRVRR